MSHLKLSIFFICSVLALGPYVMAQNLALNPGFETAYTGTDPNFVAADWRYSTLSTAAPNVIAVSRMAGAGVSGSYSLHAVFTGNTTGTSDTKGAWMSIPVVAGRKYQINGKWRGNIMVDQAGSSRCMVEFFVGFTNTANARATSDVIVIKKRLQYSSTSPFYTNSYNIDTATGIWDWENITLSPVPNYASGSTVPWDGAGTVTAQAPTGGTDSPLYMTLRVALTGADTTSTAAYVDLDNVTVTSCQAAVTGDLNGDCATNFRDFALLAAQWKTCGLNYQSMCW